MQLEDISNRTKDVIYMTMVQSVVPYSVLTKTLKEEQKRQLHMFEMSVWKKIMGLSRKDTKT